MTDKWDERFLSMASLIGSWSKDPTSTVGAVITDSRNMIVSLGFNGFPRGVADVYDSRESKLAKTIHAEVNAILTAKCDLTGHSIYITHPPCAQCVAKLIQSGVSRVVYYKARDDFARRWADDLRLGAEMLIEAGVAFVAVDRP